MMNLLEGQREAARTRDGRCCASLLAPDRSLHLWGGLSSPTVGTGHVLRKTLTRGEYGDPSHRGSVRRAKAPAEPRGCHPTPTPPLVRRCPPTAPSTRGRRFLGPRLGWPFAVLVTWLELAPLISASSPATRTPDDKCCLRLEKQPPFQLLPRPTRDAKRKRRFWHVLKQMNNRRGSYLYLLRLIRLDVRLNRVNVKLKIAAPVIGIVH